MRQQTNFSELILNEYGDQVYENDEELFNDIMIYDEDEQEVELNGISNKWGFRSNEMQNFISDLLWRLGDPDSSKKQCELADKRLDEVNERVGRILSKRLGKKIKVIQTDNSEIPGEYEEVEE
jgi:hypothetical protein